MMFQSLRSRGVVLTSNLKPLHSSNFQFRARYFSQTSKTYARASPLGRLRRWAAHPHFYYHTGGLATAAGGFYIWNLETVPISGRRCFNIVSPERELAMGKTEYDSLLEQYKNEILPNNNPDVRNVKRVLSRLVAALDHLQSNEKHFQDDDKVVSGSGRTLENWEVHVIKADIPNAFVIPGNKVFVFTGILPICKTDNGLATVLGHEISHNICHHAAESMSTGFIRIGTLAIAFVLAGYIDYSWLILSDLAFSKPRSRTQESEADHIGLQLMALACFDPREAEQFWGRMEQTNKMNIPTFMSTHPSNEQRITQIHQWMPDALNKYDNSNCGRTSELCK
jgi:predicted Zn-dependent protease